MPIQKLVIEYINDKPIFPPDHFRMEKYKYGSVIAWESLIEFLTMYSDEGIITPIYPLEARKDDNT